MTIAQAQQIADKMETGDVRDFLTIRSTGMRPSECYSMQWESLNLDRHVYANPSGKTRSARRTVPLVDLGLGDPVGILRRRHLEQGMAVQGWVFPSTLAPSGHIESIGQTFNAARDRAGLPKTLILYSSRHGALTDLSQALTTREVMDIGGHSDMQVAARYQHPDVDSIQNKIVTHRKVM
jgi:integrase